MKQKLLKAMLLLCALIVGGASSVWADTTGTIIFGSASGSTNINKASITGNDSQSKTWTVTTAGTTSFTPNASYAQIGSGSKPATSITFTATIADENVNVKSISAKFGGFSGTAGTITLKVGDTTVGTGSLNATSDVTVSSSSAQTGKVLTVTVTGISKGVKAYYISYTYAAAASGEETTTTIDASGITNTSVYGGNTEAGSLSASVTYGTPAATVPEASVTWSGDDDEVATINASTGEVTLVGVGTVTFTATYAGVANTYLGSSDTYEMTVTNDDPDIVTIWSEDFSDYDANDVPDGGTYGYACDDGDSNTKIYSASLAGGSSPELLVGKSGGSFTATIPLSNSYSGNLTLTFKTNNGNIAVSTSTEGVTVTGSVVSGTSTLTLSDVTTAMENVVIIFTNSESSNVRLDDIELKGKKASVPITSIAFSEPKTTSLGVGGTETLTPTVFPAYHTEAIDWESDDPDVATVSSTGVVTGVAAGTAHITAKAHDNPSTIYDVCTVTVTAAIPVTGVSLNKTSTTLLLGGTETLTATVAPADATNKNVTWTSADGTKVSVENGVITALALTSGSPVNITVTTEDGSFTATCAVTVNPIPVSEVSLDKTSATLKVGKTLTLTGTVLPDNATDKSVTWESDDEDVATVDAGVVTAVAVGTATITVKSNADNTKYATCEITVTDGAIDLTSGTAVSFTNFSGAGNGYNSGADKNVTFTASDGNEYDFTGNNFMSNNGLQLRSSGSQFTSPNVKATYGYRMTLTHTNGLDVYIGSEIQTAVETKTYDLPNNSSFTLKASSGTPVVTNITLTPLKQPVATDLAITDPGTLAKDATGTFAYTASTEESNTKAWTSNNTSVITITNASSGAYSATGHGTAKITLTLTPDDATTYDAVVAERTISVTTPVVVTASDVDMTYGYAAKAIGASTSDGYAGTLSYVSGNTSIATVDASGNVTAVAAGSTTITISAPADAEHYYTAGEDVVIDVTVSAPAGLTTAKTTTPVTVVSQTLLNNSLPANWTGDGSIWSGSSSYGAVTANGTIGDSYDLKTESIDLTDSYSAASVTFQHTGNKTFSTTGTGRAEACKLFVKDGETETQLTINTMFAGDDWDYVTNTTDLTDYIGKTIQLIFRYTPSSGNQGKWEVKNFSVSATPTPTESVKLNAYGYATFCSVYPLDFTGVSDYSAWQITDANSSTGVITFSQITGSVIGGTGILLKGTAGATVTLTSADSDEELDDNLLYGTLAPTYVSANEYFGLSGQQFVKVNAGTVPAGKALLPYFDKEGEIKSFTFIFETATGVRTVEKVSAAEAEAIFNLAGQRIQKPQRGINIVNGRKVVVK